MVFTLPTAVPSTSQAPGDSPLTVLQLRSSAVEGRRWALAQESMESSPGPPMPRLPPEIAGPNNTLF